MFVFFQKIIDKLLHLDFLGSLALRIYLAPIFILAGLNKLKHIDDMVGYFTSIGIPNAEILIWVAALTELIGGIFLLLGFAVRWAVIPLMFTMAVAAWTVHWENGWHALPETQLTMPWEWRMDKIEGAVERRDMVKSLAQDHGNYEWLTAEGGITILKDGIEFAATYFIMLLALFFLGAGKYLSVDYWIRRSRMPDI
ncbi:MAG: DoxX family protein [Gammaproteobacteria bacterium]